MTHPDHISDISHPEFAGEIREQVRRVLASPVFSKSTQIAHFLKFLVEGSLSGNGEDFRQHIKEYSIAVEVFGRPANFTPDADNIVRVEARRLRAKLAQYYHEDGAIDPILITIPAGTYVPTYRRLTDSELDLSGRIISHYKLLKRKFVNRWQSTYEAQCLQLERAVTVILPTRMALEDESRRKRLFDSLRGSATEHLNVISIHEMQETGLQRMVVLATALDSSLQQHVERTRMTKEQVIQLARALVSALASGHRAGLIHANLNPELVRIDPASESDGTLIPQILPFGLAALADLEHPGFTGFRPPEYLAGRGLDLRSDVWSFGALMWFALHGVGPPAELDNGLPPELKQVIARSLDQDPAARYGSALEIQEDLLSAPEKRLPAPLVAPPKTFWRRPVLLAAALLALLVSGLLFRTLGPQARPSDKLYSAESPRVVVLPFENTGNDAKNAPHSRVIAELIAEKLARLPGVELVSSRFINSEKEMAAEFLQKKLHVNYTVGGTLRKAGPDFYATIQLRHLPNNEYVWTEDYQGPWTQLSVRAQSLAEHAAESMNVFVRTKENQVRPPPRTIDPLAAEAWIKGRFAVIENWNEPSAQHFKDAERRLLEALRLEPAYVDAMVDLGSLYLSAAYPPEGNQAQLLNRAETLARKALDLDSENAPAQALMGTAYTDSGRPALAIPFLQHAVKSAPQDAIGHNSLSIAYESMGFWESSLAERERAAERDPLLSGISLGGLLLRARLGRLAEAFAIEDATPQATQRLAYLHLLRDEPAVAEKILREVSPPSTPGRKRELGILLALAQAVQGRADVAKEAVRKFATSERLRNERFILLCALAGDKPRLLAEIARHPYRREYRWVITEPLLRPYRSDADFQKLVRTLYREWQQHLAAIGQSLPLPPPRLPDPDTYFRQ